MAAARPSDDAAAFFVGIGLYYQVAQEPYYEATLLRAANS
jgi:hypothetical protein